MQREIRQNKAWGFGSHCLAAGKAGILPGLAINLVPFFLSRCRLLLSENLYKAGPSLSKLLYGHACALGVSALHFGIALPSDFPKLKCLLRLGCWALKKTT